MANNRLYILDCETAETLMVAKSFGGGWVWWKSIEEMNEWISLRDGGASFGGPAGLAATRLRFMTESDMPNPKVLVEPPLGGDNQQPVVGLLNQEDK